MLDRRLTATGVDSSRKPPGRRRMAVGGSVRAENTRNKAKPAPAAGADTSIGLYPAWVAYTELVLRRERAHPCAAYGLIATGVAGAAISGYPSRILSSGSRSG